MKPPILTQAKDTEVLTYSYLESKDLVTLSRSCKELYFRFKKANFEKKKASELLWHVFHADPEKVKKMLSQTVYYEDDKSKIKMNTETKTDQSKPKPKIIPKGIYLAYQSFTEALKKPKTKTLLQKSTILLTKTCMKEDFASWEGRDNWHVKRIWRNISPLEAAAWIGDIFLVRELLKYVPATQFKTAAIQLQEILTRKETAEHGAFLAPYTTLILVYEEYLKAANKFLTEFKDIEGTPIWYIRRDEFNDVAKKLMHEVWLCQKNLPTYGLQEYRDVKAFHARQSFQQEPRRTLFPTCLDIDSKHSMPFGGALYKGYRVYHPDTDPQSLKRIIGFEEEPTRCEIRLDRDALRALCAIRRDELVYLINKLMEEYKPAPVKRIAAKPAPTKLTS